MTLDEILNNLHQSVVLESNTGDSESSDQRERNYRAYYMEPLDSDVATDEDGEEIKSNLSDFISSDVFDVVEDTKAALSETFAPHRNVIRFKSTGPEDVDSVELANQYTRRIFWDDNNGYDFIRDSAHDGCITKNAIAKVYWKELEESEEIPVDGMNPEQVLMLLSQENMEPGEGFDVETVEVQGTIIEVFTGSIIATKDVSVPCLELVPPESFFADHNQKTTREFLVAQDRVATTFDELKSLGATDGQIDQLNPDTSTDMRDVEDIARHENDSTYQFYQNQTVTDGQDEAWLYNGHFFADIDGTGARAWYIKYCGKLIIGNDEAYDEYGDMSISEAIQNGIIRPLKRMPYHTWTPYPLSHRWSGMAVADPVYVVQEIRTKMQRSIIDYMARTNNPRLQGDSENIENFNEFIENKIGGFVDLEDPSQPVTAIDQPQMSPLVFQTLEMVTQERDERVPVTRTAAGRNQDVISNQNAENMVDKMASRGERRMAMIARNYAEFLKGILKDLYLTGVEYDEKPVKLEVNGEPQEVIPRQMPKHAQMEISVALTPGEAHAEAQRLLGIHERMLADPVLSEMYLPKNRHALMSEVGELMDRKDFSRFITNPSDPEYQQMQQARQQAEADQQKQMVQEQQAFQAHIVQMQGQIAVQIENMKAEQDKRDTELKTFIEGNKLLLKDREVAVKEATATVAADAQRVETEAQGLENAAVNSGLIDLANG